MSNLKNVAIVAGHFVPSNLAGVHRSRLWAQFLEEFGWKPIIVTTHWDYYEESLDWELEKLLSKDLTVIRTPAIPTRPLRIVGDVGVRAMPFHYRALRELAVKKKIDFLHITIPSMFSALLGRIIYSRYGIPYGIDYIDPWVHRWPGVDRWFSKAWFSYHLGNWLEPWAVRDASLITGVAPLYYEAVLKRNPHLRQQTVTAAMPYGSSEIDFQMVRKQRIKPYIFDPNDGNFHFIYAGAMLPKAYSVLENFFKAIVALKGIDLNSFNKLRIHFVGTGKNPNDPLGFNIKPLIDKYSLSNQMFEHPQRHSYFDVLNHLQLASAVLVVGSTEAHYTPSKIFQSIQSGRPVFAMLHENSSAVEILTKSKAGLAITLTEESLPNPEALAIQLGSFIDSSAEFNSVDVDHGVFHEYSAKESARKLAMGLDEALIRNTQMT